MDARKPRHLFAVPSNATWLDAAVLSAKSRLLMRENRVLSPTGKALKNMVLHSK